MATVYEINKGINRSVEFKGIKAQYIVYLAVGLISLLLLFAILYLIGVGIYISLAIIIPLGISLFIWVQKFSHKYGEHGLLKKTARRKLPRYIISTSRKVFISLRVKDYEEEKNSGRRSSNI